MGKRVGEGWIGSLDLADVSRLWGRTESDTTEVTQQQQQQQHRDCLKVGEAGGGDVIR